MLYLLYYPFILIDSKYNLMSVTKLSALMRWIKNILWNHVLFRGLFAALLLKSQNILHDYVFR
jgi:hypothetical protein